MATRSTVDQDQVDLNINRQVFDDVKRLESSLQGVLKVLNSVSSGFKGMSIPGVSSTDPRSANLGSQIAILTRDVRTLLAAARQSGAINQAEIPALYTSTYNQGRVQAASQAQRYSNSRVDLELANAQVKAAERRFDLLKSQDVLEEASRRRAVNSIGMQTQARKELANLEKNQAEYSKALLANDEQAARLAKQELIAGRQRLDQLESELKLRQAGARVRLANAMDSGTKTGQNTADAQLRAVNESMAQVRAAQAAQDRMMRQAEVAAETRRRQERTRQMRENMAAERYAASYGPTIQTRQAAMDRDAARAQSDAYRPTRLAATQTQLLANYTATRMVMDSMRAGIQFTLQYEEELMHLRTITKATDEQMQGLQSTIESVSNATRYSADDLTNAAAALSETGVTINQMGGSLKAVSDLATATGANFTMSVNTVTGSLGAFKMSANDTVDVSNMIAQAVNSSRLTMDKLKTSIETAGETASQAGVSFKEFLAAAATISDSGTGTGQTLGNGMRQLLLDLENPSKGLKDALSRLGLVEEDINVKTQGLYGALMNLKSAGFTASDAMNVFEARSSSAFNALTSNLQKMENFQESLLNTDAATRANADQMETLGAQFDRVRNQTNLLVSEGLKPMAWTLTNVFETVADAEGKMKEFSGVVQAVGALLSGGAFAVGLKYTAQLLGGLAALTFTSGGVGARVLAASTWATLAGPIGLYVGGIAAVTGGLAYLITQLTKTEDLFEKQRTRVNESKAALQESAQAYDTIGRRISNVQDKMLTMNRDTSGAMLRREVNDVARQFEEYGVVLDRSAIKKTEDLISALQRLRTELGKRYAIDASILANDLETLALRAGDKASKTALDARSQPFRSGSVDKALALPGIDRGPVNNWGFWSGQNGLEDRRFRRTLDGGTSSGYVAIDGNMNLANLDALMRFLKDSGVTGLDGIRSGMVEAFRLNGKNQPTDLNAVGQAISGVSAWERLAQAQISNPQSSSEQRRLGEANVQLAQNMATTLRSVQQVMQEREKADRDASQARESEASAQYRQSPEALKLTEEVNAVVRAANVAMATRADSSSQTVDALWEAVKQAESRGRQFDSSGNPLTSPRGAIGISQMLPSTGPEAARMAGVEWDEERFRNDGKYNEQLGRAYLESLLKRYGGNQMLATSAYNWGMGNVDNLLKRGDPRIPGSGTTSTDFMMRLPEETRRYNQATGTADYASGLGVLGSFNALMADKGKAQARIDISDKLRDVNKQREDAVKAGNDFMLASFDEQIRVLSESKSGMDKLYAGSRAAAEQSIGRVATAQQRNYAAQIEADRRAISDEKDPEVVNALYERIKAMTNMVYDSKIKEIKDKNEAKYNANTGTFEYDEETSTKLLNVQDEWDAAIRKEVEGQKQKIEEINDVIFKKGFGASLRDAGYEFKALMNRLDARRKGATKSLEAELDQNQINTGLRGLQQGQRMMSDPRYASQYSAAQREYMTRSIAEAQDVTNQADYVAVSRKVDELNKDVQVLRKMLEPYDRLLGEGDSQDGSLYQERDKHAENTMGWWKADEQIKAAQRERQRITDNLSKSETDLLPILQQQKNLYEEISQVPPPKATVKEGMKMANDNFINSFDEETNFVEGYSQYLQAGKGSLATFLQDITNRSKTAGDAFKDFGRNVMTSLADIASQYLAMAAIKGLLQMIGSIAGAAGGITASAGYVSSGPAIDGAMADSGWTSAFNSSTALRNIGGRINHGSAPMRLAGGGLVPGGLPRDSVSALLRPGEMVMNTEAVSAVGEGFLQNLNTYGRREVQTSAPPRMPTTQRDPDMTNVYVVAPDQQPTMGPKDVLVVLQDDILRGGQTKKLIKAVAMGQA